MQQEEAKAARKLVEVAAIAPTKFFLVCSWHCSGQRVSMRRRKQKQPEGKPRCACK